MLKLSLLLVLGSLAVSYGYNVLCVFPVPTHSHSQLGKGIVDSLLKAGHTVTWITPFPEKVGKNPPKTLKIVDVSEVQKFTSEQNLDLNKVTSAKVGLAHVKQFANNITKSVLTNSAVVDLVVNVQYDAVVTEIFFSDALAGIAAVQQVPWIVLSGTQLMPMVEQQVDEVRSVSTVPLLFNDASIPMNFKERAINAFIYIFMACYNWFIWSDEVALYKQLFTPIASARNVPLPPLEEAYHNVSILLVNAHESLSPTFSAPPNVVQIAGYHINENPPPLPKDLQELLDNSKNGVIYFSMGSVLRSSGLQAHTRKALLEKFAALPYTVLWKFEDKIDEKLPPNVHIRPWMPQPSILAHPNVKVFITHGGQLSTLEAVHAGVPLLAIPVFADQPANAERAVRAGYALRVTFDPNMADEVDLKLKELLNNPSFNERMKYLSKLFRGRPIPPSQLVSHYIELAIETKGAHHLRSLSLQYTWVQRWLLDIALAVMVVFAVITALLILLVTTCYRKIRGLGSKSANKKDLNKKKRN